MEAGSLLCELSAPDKRTTGAGSTMLAKPLDNVRQFQPEPQNHTSNGIPLDGSTECRPQLQTATEKQKPWGTGGTPTSLNTLSGDGVGTGRLELRGHSPSLESI